jgi:antitoxin VapB
VFFFFLFFIIFFYVVFTEAARAGLAPLRYVKQLLHLERLSAGTIQIAERNVSMNLSIQNKETHRLAKELAALTGESITVAVTEAIYERLRRVQKEKGVGLAEQLMTIANHSAPRFKPAFNSADIDELLYDDLGLPK